MKIYVLLMWYYERDSYLVNSFEGVFSSYDEAYRKIGDFNLPSGDVFELDYIFKKRGGYGSEPCYEIRECIV